MEKVKKHSKEVRKYNEKMLMQRAKFDWLRMGDEDNSFFNGFIKTKQNAKSIRGLHKTDGTPLHSHLNINGKLMGKEDNNLLYFWRR